MELHEQLGVWGRGEAELDTASDGSSEVGNVGTEADGVLLARCVHGGYLVLKCFDVGGVG